MKSWKLFCPDWEIIRWDESNLPLESAPKYVREAYKEKKWAFVADYFRFKVLYIYGGIYLDTDCEIIKDINPLLENKAFLGMEWWRMINAAVIGSCPKDTVAKEILDYYEQLSFYKNNGEINTTVIGKIITPIFDKYGLIYDDSITQDVAGWHIYPRIAFYPVSIVNSTKVFEKNDDTMIIHWMEETWQRKEYKKAWKHNSNKVIILLRKTFLIKVYYKAKLVVSLLKKGN